MSTILAAEFKNNDEDERHPLVVPTMVFCTAINGMTVGILWASANSFVASCAND